jgi:type II secretory pathway component GspD/PulD (secretin)
MLGSSIWQQRTKLSLIAAIVMVFSVSLTAGVLGDTDADALGEQRLINIDVKDGAIDAVLRMLAKAANVNIVIGENVTGRVEAVSLRDVSVETALQLITVTHGYHWTRQGNVYVVTAKPLPEADAQSAAIGRGDTTVPAAVGVADPGLFTGPDSSDRTSHEPEAELAGPASPQLRSIEPSTIVTPSATAGEPGLVTKMFPLKFRDAEELAWAFGGTVVGSRLAASNLPDSRLSDRRHVAARSPEPFAGPDIFGGASSSTSRWGQAPGGFGGARGGIGAGGFGGAGGRGGIAGRGGAGGSGGLGAMLPGEMEPPIAFMPENALIVRGTQAEIDKFSELVEMLDLPARQVEISTKFVDVITSEQEALGIDWTVATGALEFWNLGFAPGEAVSNVVKFARGRFTSTLAALETTGRAVVVNAPHVTCPNNQYAEVSFSTEIPYYVATTEYNQFGQRIATQVDWETTAVENSLMVLPRINADDTITIELYPILEDQVGEVVGPNGETMPIIVSQEVSTTVTVADGDTIVLGGLIRKNEAYTYQNTPLLSKLPVIGKLFRSKRAQSSNSELLIFVTPRIIREVPPQ